MSKKKRKTRREKENLKSHQFINQKTTTVNKENIDKGKQGGNSVVKKKTNIPAYIMKDFRKVILITSIVIGFTLLMWILVYQTNLFNFVFDKLNIKY